MPKAKMDKALKAPPANMSTKPSKPEDSTVLDFKAFWSTPYNGI